MSTLSHRQRWELRFVLVVSALVVLASLAAWRFDLVSGNRAVALYDKGFTPVEARFTPRTGSRASGRPCPAGSGLIPDGPGASRFGFSSRVIGLALSGTAVQLLRFNSYVFLVPLQALWAWRQAAGNRRYVAAPILFIALLSAPHMVHNDRAYGDPMYSVNVHFAFTRNHEFVNVKQIGCDGCPSREVLQVDCCGGPPVGLYGYLFGMHSLEEIVERMSQGYLDMYLRPTVWFGIQSGTQSYPGYLLYLVGLGAVLLSPYREMVGVIVLLADGIPFAITFGIDPRIGIQTAPFVAFILAYGIWWMFERLVSLRTLRPVPDAPGASAIRAARLEG